MSDWKTATLGEVCTLIARGIAPKYLNEGGTLVLNQKCVRNHTINYDLGRRHDASAKRVAADRFVQLGDVLINSTGTGTLGRIAQVRSNPPEPTTVDTHVTIARPSPSEFHPDFFGYALVVLEEQLAVSGEGASGQTELARTTITNFQISYPIDHGEQRRIVAVLDEAFAAIALATANAEKNLANARELFESAFRQRFDHVGNGWQIYNLPEISENWDYLRRPVTKSDRVPGDVPYYGASGQVDSVRDHLFDDDLLLISEDGANLLMRTYPIAFSISGKSWVNNHAHILKFDDMATQRLVEYYLNSISLAPWVSGMAQPKLNQKALNSIPIPLPPKSERAKLVGELDDLADRIERLEANQEQRLGALASLKQSLLHRAFTGELTAASPNLVLA